MSLSDERHMAGLFPKELRRLAKVVGLKSTVGTALDMAADEIEALRASQVKLVEALRQFADCDLNEGNCASLEVATRRIRSVARAALAEKHAKEDGHEPE